MIYKKSIYVQQNLMIIMIHQKLLYNLYVITFIVVIVPNLVQVCYYPKPKIQIKLIMITNNKSVKNLTIIVLKYHNNSQ